MVPTLGDNDQVTAVLPVPVTVAVNACCSEGASVAVLGDTDTVISGAVLVRLNEAGVNPVTEAVTRYSRRSHSPRAPARSQYPMHWSEPSCSHCRRTSRPRPMPVR